MPGVLVKGIAMTEKKTESVKVWMSREMFEDIALAAAEDDRSVSEFISRLVKKELYGCLINAKRGKQDA